MTKVRAGDDGATCLNCRYMDAPPGLKELLECRRHAPVLVSRMCPDGVVRQTPEWPLIEEGEWCGDWEAMP